MEKTSLNAPIICLNLDNPATHQASHPSALSSTSRYAICSSFLLGRLRSGPPDRAPQWASTTGMVASMMMWRVAPPKIIWRSRLWV
jgi:hypothetical protein